MKAGKRASIRKENKERIKEVHKILEHLDIIAHRMIESGVTITEENAREEANSYTNRDLGDLEFSILMSKLKHFQNALEERRLEVHK